MCESKFRFGSLPQAKAEALEKLLKLKSGTYNRFHNFTGQAGKQNFV